MKTLQIDPSARVLIGSELGRRERERLDFDRIDDSEEGAIVEIRTPAVLSDFIRALVGPSVRKLGFKKFTEKYQFETTPSVREIILENARVAADGPGDEAQ